MDAVNLLQYAVVCNVISTEIGETKADCSVFGIGYENKIAPGINSIRFQAGRGSQLFKINGIG